MNRCLPNNARLLIDLLSTVNQILKVLSVARISSFIQVLKNISHKFVFSNLEGVFSRGGAVSVGSKVGKKSRLLEITIVRSDMQRSVMILILAVQDLLQKKLDIVLELLDYHIVVLWAQQMLELSKNVFVLSWVKLGIFFVL